ncbi:MAG: hypothetical protein GY869_01285 [Planctomycetes bacterium]|nr:hypothetical protein [Planctomycetota bacterium]
MRFSYKLVTALLICCLVTADVWAQDMFDMDVELGWESCYRPSQWMPVDVSVYTQVEQPFEGAIEVSTQQDSLNAMTVHQNFVAVRDLPSYIPLVTKLAYAANECHIRLLDDQGRIILRENRSILSDTLTNVPLTGVHENELLIGVIGSRTFSLLRIPDYSVCRLNLERSVPDDLYGQYPGLNQKPAEDEGGKVYVKHKLERMACFDWTGYAGLDLLVMYNPEWDQLRPKQLEAISEWVGNGGKLLVVLGSNPLPTNDVMENLLPFDAEGARQVKTISSELGLWRWPLGQSSDIVARPLSPRASTRIYKPLTLGGNNEILFAVGHSGFGKVGVLAYDPMLINDADPISRAKFWVFHMTSVMENSENKPIHRSIKFKDKQDEPSDSSFFGGYFESGIADGGSTAVLNRLMSIPELKPLSIWWVILLLALLALLLGPVDYYVLKKKDRLPWTWLTCTGWIIVFSAVAYYGVAALRGGQMRVQTLSVWDGLQGRQECWSTTYTGLFAPESDKYQLEWTEPTGKQWWSGIAPTGEYLYEGEQSASRRIVYSQIDGENIPVSVPINIWTMQTLLVESTRGSLPFNATVDRQGNEVTVTITNYYDSAIKYGYIFFDQGRRMSFVEKIEAGETKEFSDTLSTGNKLWDLNQIGLDYSYSFFGPTRRDASIEAAYYSHGCFERTQMIKSYLEQGAAVVCVEYDKAPPPYQVAGRDTRFEHNLLVRQVVFPRD